ncbi:hypothetical protein OBP_021 [Pseudomonas phage OBP]|uniref:hypothetical protein n=1 Tax=Pseudomonas phage OBP TaxID=1124849 RepID=UPI000240D612|nr:hypothetical protein OBP_021 [Pseudomonas phage OBP]AEV89458.1 hypothetical protein OBP_021 [Pseudomonas phage OBP]
MVNEFYKGFILGIALLVLGRILYNWALKQLGPEPRPGIDISHLVQLPKMNSRDLGFCLNQILLDPVLSYTINTVTPKDKDDIVTIWFNIHDEEGKVTGTTTVRCKVDEELPDTYPLGYRKKK